MIPWTQADVLYALISSGIIFLHPLCHSSCLRLHQALFVFLNSCYFTWPYIKCRPKKYTFYPSCKLLSKLSNRIDPYIMLINLLLYLSLHPSSESNCTTTVITFTWNPQKFICPFKIETFSIWSCLAFWYFNLRYQLNLFQISCKICWEWQWRSKGTRTLFS